MYFKNRETAASFLLLRIYKLYLFIHVCVVWQFQKDTWRNENYAECLQTKYDNRREINVKEISILISALIECRNHIEQTLKYTRYFYFFATYLQWQQEGVNVFKSKTGDLSYLENSYMFYNSNPPVRLVTVIAWF